MQSTPRHPTSRILLVVATIAAALLATAAPALANDLVIRSLEAVCSDDGTDGIAFTVGTDRTGEAAEHPDILVEWRPSDSAEFRELARGELTADNGYTFSQTVTGLDLDGLDQVVVRATAVRTADGGDTWGDGRAAGDTYTSRLDVSECGEDLSGDARVSWTAGCPTNGVPTALLYNDAPADEGAPVTFRVVGTMDDLVSETTIEVEAGGEPTGDGRTLDPRADEVELVFVDDAGDTVDPEDRTITLTVHVDGAVEFERTFTVDCEDGEPTPPSAAATGQCADQGGVVVVDLDNPTAEPVAFELRVDGEVVRTVEVPAETATVVEHAVADGTHAVVVTAGGTTLLETSVDLDCVASPSAEATVACFEQGVLEVELRNPDAAPATFEVLVDGTVVDTRQVAEATETGSWTVQDGEREVVVRADGETVLEETLSVDCALVGSTAAAVEVVCTADEGRLVATVDNPGDAPTTVQLLVDGVVRTGTEVAAGAVAEVGVDGVADGDRRVVVTADGETIHDRTLAVDCVEVRGVTDSQEPAPGGDGEGPAPAPDDDVVVAGEQLPATGVGTLAWLLVSLLLLFLGGDLVLSELLSRVPRGR